MCWIYSLLNSKLLLPVTGAYVHAYRQRNNTYGQTVIRSIYDTRWLEHSHSPIHRYKRRPTGTRFMAPLNGILSDMAQYTATYMATAMSDRIPFNGAMKRVPVGRRLYRWIGEWECSSHLVS